MALPGSILVTSSVFTVTVGRRGLGAHGQCIGAAGSICLIRDSVHALEHVQQQLHSVHASNVAGDLGAVHVQAAGVELKGYHLLVCDLHQGTFDQVLAGLPAIQDKPASGNIFHLWQSRDSGSIGLPAGRDSSYYGLIASPGIGFRLVDDLAAPRCDSELPQ
jgi:hypothetical protein